MLVADAPAYEHGLAEPLAALIVSLAGGYEALVAPATTAGKNVMPRVAALLDVMQVSDITKVVSPDTFERPIYAGNAIQTVQATDPKKVITVRTAAFPAAVEGGSAAIEPVGPAQDPELSTFKGEEIAKSRASVNQRRAHQAGDAGAGEQRDEHDRHHPGDLLRPRRNAAGPGQKQNAAPRDHEHQRVVGQRWMSPREALDRSHVAPPARFHAAGGITRARRHPRCST